MHSSNLGELFAAAMKEVPGAEDRFFDALADKTVRLVRVIGGARGLQRRDVLDDLVQETLQHFLRALRERGERLASIEDWDATLATVVWWRVNDYFRVSGRRSRIECVSLDDVGVDLSVAATAVSFAAAAGDLQEKRDQIRTFCDDTGVDPTTMQVVDLKLTGHTFREIAERLGLSQNACNLRYYRFSREFVEWLDVHRERSLGQ